MTVPASMDHITREETIFNAAADLPDPAKRASYLDLACDGDPDLRARLEKMLAADDDSFFERPLPSPALPGIATLVVAPSPDPEPATLGEHIGRYKLLQKIGEGGCGVVYMAEQEEPVRRRVALKVIKLGMDTKTVIARFEAERQALALMDHPNIAKVLDAGATETGRPYFVMELVRGVRITDYCDQNHLPTGGRLALFTQVCHAIQHAHQKGIIHRDIKPSNILVTLHDGVPVPKVIDFGIAKATTDQRLTDKTLFTALEQFIGTPAYMSPEQAELSGLDIDTRSDIYSLGVLLYELLTGRTPFDGQELLASGLDEMRRTIREREPVRPSTKLSQTLAGTDVSRLTSKSEVGDPNSEIHGASPSRLLQLKETIALLRGDVDWIVMKCLEKDRARRYETANGLASDIQRYLNNEAVFARPPSTAYRVQKLVRRNKLAFAAITAVATVLVLGVIVSTWQAIRAIQAKREAVEQRQAADKSTQVARQAEQKAESAAVELNRHLYLAEMNLAGNAAAEPGGIGRIADLTARWRPEHGAADLRGWEWYYLRSLLRRDLFTISGHAGDVKAVAWSPDGKRLASGSTDKKIKIWDAATGQEIHTFSGHTSGVLAVAWSPDGKHLVSGSEDHSMKVWDLASGQLIHTLREHTNQVRSVAWSRDGKRLASGSEDRTIKIWDTGNWTNIRTLPGHTDAVNAVAWSPDGRRLASASYDRSIKIWDVDGDQLPLTLIGHEYWVNSVSWSPDGKRLASGGADRMVRFWDTVAGTQIQNPNAAGQFDNVQSVSWSPDGKYVASGREDSTVSVQDAISGANLFTHRGHHQRYVCSVAWSPDGKQLASGSEDGTIKFWDATREETLTLRGHTDTANSVVWSPDGRFLVSGGHDHTIKIWDPDSGQESRTLREHTDSVAAVAWSPGGRFLLSGSQDRTLKVWDMVTGTHTSINRAHNQYSSGVAWSPDGKQFASISEDNTIQLYDATNGQVALTLPGHSKTVHSIAWSPDGKFLASGSWDKTVRIWDARRGTPILKLGEDTGPSSFSSGFSSVAWSPDGKYLVAGSFDKTVKVWDAVSGEMIHVLRGHSGGVLAVSWNPDGNRLASASFDGTVKLWDVASGLETITLRAHTFGVLSVAWSPDGKRLASGGYDHEVKIWDARKGYAAEAAERE